LPEDPVGERRVAGEGLDPAPNRRDSHPQFGVFAGQPWYQRVWHAALACLAPM
jgi:hypothetical protein